MGVFIYSGGTNAQQIGFFISNKCGVYSIDWNQVKITYGGFSK
jgi:hypothetical protein